MKERCWEEYEALYMISECERVTLTGLIHETATLSGRGIFFIEGGDKDIFCSYSEIYGSALSVARFFADCGLQPGNELVFQLRDNREFITAFWACLISGIIPVPLSIGIAEEQKLKVRNVWKSLNSPYLLTTRKTGSNLSLSGEENRICYFEDVDFSRSFQPDYEPSEDDIAFIQFSSGSTGTPKGVTLTHKNLLTNIRAIHHGINSPETGDLFCSWMPLTHDMGLIGFHLTPLFRKWDHYIIPTELFIRNPNIWLKKIHQHKITFTSSPNFGFRYTLKHFARHDIGDLDLSLLRTIVNGAEPISASICREFTEKFAPCGLSSTAIFPVYGLAEASLAVSFSEIGKEIKTVSVDRSFLRIGDHVREMNDGKDAVSFVEVGSPVEGCSVRITGHNHELLEDGCIGEIGIKGGNVTRGYYNNPAATENTIDDGWLSTGDLGFFRNGRLYITGRKKDVLFINGQNFYSHDIERVAESVPGIELGKIAVAGGFSEKFQREQVLVFVLFKGKPEKFVPLYRELKQLINQVFGFEPDAIVPVREINKTTSGKVQRYLLLSRYEEGAFDAALDQLKNLLSEEETAKELPANPVEESLLKIWETVLEHARFGTTDKFLHIGGNSLKAARIAALASQEFDREISLDVIFRGQTIRQIAAVISQLPKPDPGRELTKAPLLPYYPLTDAQKRLYYTWSLDKNSIAYNVPLALEISGPVDHARLENAFREVVKRHNSLKACFILQGEEIVQSFDGTPDVALEYAEIDKEQVPAFLKESVKPFDPGKPGLFRTKLAKTGEAHFILFLDFHHIIADGISVQCIVNELFRLYRGETMTSPLFDYMDYVAWKSRPDSANNETQQENYWLSRFEDGLPVLHLPLSYPRPAVFQSGGRKIKATLFPGAAGALKKLSLQYELSVFSLTYTIYTILLSKFCNQDDLVIGVPVSGRNSRGLEQMVGMFVNNLALRSRITGSKTFAEFLQEQNRMLLDAFKNQSYDFGKLIEKLDQKRDISRNPVFDTMFIYQDVLFREGGTEFTVAPYFFDPGFSKYDLSLEVVDSGEELDFYFEYNTALFGDELIERLAGYFNTLAENIIADPHCRTGELSILPAAEKLLLTEALSIQGAVPPVAETIDALFEKSACSYPDQTALSFEGEKLSYRELERQVRLLAGRLSEKGIRKGDTVCICMDRTPELVISMLAVLKCGACFVPADISLPAERLNYMTGDCGAKALLTMRGTAIQVNGCDVIFADELLQETVPVIHEVEQKHNLDDLAYILYTSGTTGRPKGVMITHRSLANYANWAAQTYAGNKPARFPLYTSISFDLTITSVFVPLICGGTIIIYKDEEAVSLLEKVVSSDADVIKLTPPHLKILNSYPGNKLERIAKNLEVLIVGGENLTTSLAHETVEKLGRKISIYNEYGPTEATVGCMIHQYDPEQDTGASVPIGVPIRNTRIYLLDPFLNMVPAGVEGELYISGEGLARGYVNKPELTAERFLEDPFVAGAVMYKTGDRAKRLLSGVIEYTGRADQQVKINGYRIEPAEIESQLLLRQEITDAVVTVRSDESGQQFLCAYVCSKEGTDVRKLRDRLSDSLPVYMIPAFIVEISAVPLTRNGKTDFAALPDPLQMDRTTELQRPANETEQLLLQVWQSVLHKKAISTDDNFFQLGGDSIKAMQIASRLYTIGYGVEIKDIFSCQTVQRLAAQVKTLNGVQYEQGLASGAFSYTPVVDWFFSQPFKRPAYYNQSALLKCPRNMSVPLLEKAFEAVLRHHDGLRLNHDPAGKKLFYNPAHIGKPFPVELVRAESSTEEKVIRETALRLKDSFDLANGLLLKAAVILSDECTYLFITAHHLVIDGVSWRILLEDLYTAYKNIEAGQEVILPLKTGSVREWAESLAAKNVTAASLDYWTNVISGINAGNDKDEYHYAAMSERHVLQFTLDREKTERLVGDAAKQFDVSPETLLLSVLVKAFAGSGGRERCVIELEHHGRTNGDVRVTRTIGWFTSMFPVVFDAKEETMAAHIKSVNARLKQAAAYSTDYDLACRRKNMHIGPAEIDVRFNYLGEFDFSDMQDLFTLSPVNTGEETAASNCMTVDLELQAMVQGGELTVQLIWNKQAISEDEMIRLKNAMRLAIDEILNDPGKNSEGLSTADFSTVILSQDELDQLFL